MATAYGQVRFTESFGADLTNETIWYLTNKITVVSTLHRHRNWRVDPGEVGGATKRDYLGFFPNKWRGWTSRSSFALMMTTNLESQLTMSRKGKVRKSWEASRPFNKLPFWVWIRFYCPLIVYSINLKTTNFSDYMVCDSLVPRPSSFTDLLSTLPI